MARPYGSGRTYNYHDVYDYIVDYKRSHDGSSPTLREIASICNIPSTSSVSYILEGLQYEGLIKLTSKPRSIEVVGAQWIPPSA